MRGKLVSIVGAVACWIFSTSAVLASEPKVCFTPGADCTAFIVHEIDAADKQVLVQAYYLTNARIIDALARRKKVGVEVRVILDKRNVNNGAADDVGNYCIGVMIDRKVPHAHNKVFIIDGKHVITGSYNSSNNAERNAENVLLLADAPGLADAYTENWKKRARAATAFPIEKCVWPPIGSAF